MFSNTTTPQHSFFDTAVATTPTTPATATEPEGSANQASVIVRPNHIDIPNNAAAPFNYQMSPTSYYNQTPGSYPYHFNFFFNPDWTLQFPNPDGTCSPLSNNTLPSPVSAVRSAFPPGVFGNNNRGDFGGLPASMVQYTNPKKAGRRPRELADDMEEEDDRKLKRRLRNKQAAARCRQRRLDLMSTLQQQVDELKKRNDKKTKEVMDIKNSLSAMKEYIQSHDCKMSHEAREHALKLFLPSLDTSAIFQQQQLQQQQHMHQQQQQHHRQHHQMQQNEPTTSKIREISQPQPQMNQVLTKDAYDEEIEYKPNVEFRLQGAQKRKWRPEHSEFNLNMLPPISTMTDKKMDNIGTDEGFLEPESRINKLSDPTLAQMNQGGEVERPSNLPMLTPGSSSVAITTPSRLTNSAYDAFPFAVNLGGDFLSQSTGLTPSGQPTMNFVNNTPTPLHNADLRPL